MVGWSDLMDCGRRQSQRFIESLKDTRRKSRTRRQSQRPQAAVAHLERSAKKRMRILSILLLGLSMILAGCWGKAGDESSREEAFEEVLGFALPPDVKGIESSWVFMKD